MSELAPFQLRAIKEKAELDDKLEALLNFLPTPVCHGLDFDERCRLKKQAVIMSEYSAILGDRIRAFKETATTKGE